MKTSEVLAIALNEYGEKEVSGLGHNPRILEYHAATSLKASADEISWCSAYVNWCLLKAGVAGTNLANARSFLKWGVKIDRPVLGCICVFWRGTLDSWQGHVGFYISENETHIFVLGGNQNNEVCIKKYPKNQLLEFRQIA